IPFDDKTFRYFNDLTDGWEIEGGTYEIYVGASIDDVRLQGTLEKTGTSDVIPYDLGELPSYASGKVQNVSTEEFEKLLGRPIPSGEYLFYKKNRMVIDDNCTVDDLRYSKRWAGRFCSWLVRFLTAFSRFFGIRSFESTLEIGIKHQPVRGIAKFLGFSRRQKEGMLLVFNGQLFRGLGMILFRPRKNILQAEK
ncbi:MAG: glycosyl hydrolase, partial [Lachnospiraceae bacterium]|nr:glycosyl hydrolase [Lachnospiraceae bacterium]